MNQTLDSDFSHDLIMREIYKPLPQFMPGQKRTTTGFIRKYLEENFEGFNQLKNQTEELIPQLEVEKRVDVDITKEALLFCAEGSLIKFLGIFEKLIKQHFLTVSCINFTVEYDPELEEKWISADTKISGEIEQVIKWEDSFIKDWVSQIPYPEREKIRLSCDII